MMVFNSTILYQKRGYVFRMVKKIIKVLTPDMGDGRILFIKLKVNSFSFDRCLKQLLFLSLLVAEMR